MPETKKFMNHEITLRDDFRFEIIGPEFDPDPRRTHDRLFDSFIAAKAEIESRIESSAKAGLKQVVMSSQLLNQKGSLVTVTGINRSTGRISNFGELESKAYPNVTWVREALIRQAVIQAELQLLADRLHKVTISTSRKSYGRIEATEYKSKIEQLQREISEAVKLAQELAGPQLVEQDDAPAAG